MEEKSGPQILSRPSRSWLLPIGAICAAALTLASSPAAGPVIEPFTIFHYAKSDDPYDLTNLYGFNHAPNVAVLPDGRVMAVWFSGPYEASVHQCILGAVSADAGRTWSEAKPLVDFPRASDFDPALLGDGDKIWLFFAVGRWDRYPFVGGRDEEKKKVGLDSFHVYARHSEDSGKTWSEPVQPIPERLFSRNNGIVLQDGSLLLPVYDQPDGKSVASVLRSEDHGGTWKRYGSIQGADGKAGGEPTIAELRDGSVLMALRSRDGNLWLATSKDGGRTWGEAINSGLQAAASSSSLFRTKSGEVILTYDDCKPPDRSPLVMRQLDQKTMQWGSPLKLAETPPKKETDEGTRQVSYPSVTELADGTLLAVWTEIHVSGDAQSGRIVGARVPAQLLSP